MSERFTHRGHEFWVYPTCQDRVVLPAPPGKKWAYHQGFSQTSNFARTREEAADRILDVHMKRTPQEDAESSA